MAARRTAVSERSGRGAFTALVEVTDRVRRGVVASTKGRWPGCVKGGATVYATVDERDADMGGGAVVHDDRVEVERATPRAASGSRGAGG
jgi:hypothetical protein